MRPSGFYTYASFQATEASFWWQAESFGDVVHAVVSARRSGGPDILAMPTSMGMGSDTGATGYEGVATRA